MLTSAGYLAMEFDVSLNKDPIQGNLLRFSVFNQHEEPILDDNTGAFKES